MQTLFIVEYQAMNGGTCTATEPLGYQVTDQQTENACISAFFSQMRLCGHQLLRHPHRRHRRQRGRRLARV